MTSDSVELIFILWSSTLAILVAYICRNLFKVHQNNDDLRIKRTEEQARYQISKYGFLPEYNCKDLPKNWEFLATVRDNITTTDGNLFRDRIRKLPPYNEEFLTIKDLTTEEKRYLFVLLTAAASKYLRCCGEDRIKTVVPQPIGKPLFLISQSLGVPPYMSYYSAVIWNVTSKKPHQRISLHNTDIIISYSQENHKHIKKFLVQHAMIEQLGGKCLPEVLLIYEKMEQRNDEDLIKIMKSIASSINQSAQVLDEFKKHVGKDEFFKFRSIFLGTEDTKLFPNGVTFDGVSMEPIRWGNANGGQSGLLQVFDKLVSPQHETDAKIFLKGNLKTLPQAHKDFLQMIEAKPTLFEYATNSSNEELKRAFKEIADALFKFRGKHFTLAQEYIPAPHFEEAEKLLSSLIETTWARIKVFRESWHI